MFGVAPSGGTRGPSVDHRCEQQDCLLCLEGCDNPLAMLLSWHEKAVGLSLDELVLQDL